MKGRNLLFKLYKEPIIIIELLNLYLNNGSFHKWITPRTYPRLAKKALGHFVAFFSLFNISFIKNKNKKKICPLPGLNFIWTEKMGTDYYH